MVERALFVVATTGDLRGELPRFGAIGRLLDGMLGRERRVLELVNLQPLLGDASGILFCPLRVNNPRNDRTPEDQAHHRVTRETQRPMFFPCVQKRPPDVSEAGGLGPTPEPTNSLGNWFAGGLWFFGTGWVHMKMKQNHSPIGHDVETCALSWGRWVYAIALAAVIVVASGRSRVASPDIVDFDKAAHFAVFGLLATLVARAGFKSSRLWWAILIVSLFGLTDEWHQGSTPGRSMEVYDWIADTVGAITAVALYRYVGWYRGLLEKPLFRRNARVEKSGGVVPNELR